MEHPTKTVVFEVELPEPAASYAVKFLKENPPEDVNELLETLVLDRMSPAYVQAAREWQRLRAARKLVES